MALTSVIIFEICVVCVVIVVLFVDCCVDKDVTLLESVVLFEAIVDILLLIEFVLLVILVLKAFCEISCLFVNVINTLKLTSWALNLVIKLPDRLLESPTISDISFNVSKAAGASPTTLFIALAIAVFVLFDKSIIACSFANICG